VVVRLAAHGKSMYMQGILAGFPQWKVENPAAVDAVT
jgi:hypothetical protein